MDPLATFAIVGAASQSVGENVNYVNAMFLMKEMGVEVSTKADKNTNGYKNKVGVKLTTAGGNITTIWGTMFDENTASVANILPDLRLMLSQKGK